MISEMSAMRLESIGAPLEPRQLAIPQPAAGQLLVRMRACAVCRTDLHVVDGDLPPALLPLTPGHEVIGEVVTAGRGVEAFCAGDRVGIPWLGWTCGNCHWCQSGRENLCDQARFTGYTLDGGFADYLVADHRFCFPVPDSFDDLHAAPLMCAGLIGYRALRAAGDAQHIGLYGFGAAAHIIAQVCSFQQRQVYAFTRPGDQASQVFARELGACWAGGSDMMPPHKLDAAIIFAPVGALVPAALAATDKGATVVCAGIHMSDIPTFAYPLLWQERRLVSVANLTRQDGVAFLEVAPRVPVKTRVHAYALADANRALDDLRQGRFEGAAVLVPS